MTDALLARRPRAARGQALVEMVLGVLVFVTLLMFGIFFAEVGFLTLKVQEATNFAVWDATGRRVHDIEAGKWNLLADRNNGAVTRSEAAAENRYRDFESRVAQHHAGATFMAFARASPITVSCDANLSSYGVRGTGPRDADTTTERDLQRAMPSARADAGIACHAASSMRSVQIPNTFHDQTQLFRVKHWENVPMTICGVGRAKNNRCTGKLAVLLDDWGLQTVADSRECHLNPDSTASECGNSANGNESYYEWSRRIYREFGGTGSAGRALVSSVKGSSPNETQFFMSFRGYESRFREDLATGFHGGQSRWETTPFRADNVYKRQLREANRWLGRN